MFDKLASEVRSELETCRRSNARDKDKLEKNQRSLKTIVGSCRAGENVSPAGLSRVRSEIDELERRISWRNEYRIPALQRELEALASANRAVVARKLGTGLEL